MNETTWMLDPEVTYLNHGSYGATPAPVVAEQDRWRSRLEANPMRFFDEEYHPALAAARDALCRFVGSDPEHTGFVANATTGVNAVLLSLRLRPGDQIVVTDHGYNACSNAAVVAAGRAGAEVVTVPVPFRTEFSTDVVDRIVDAVGPRTRLVLVDHVTSPTALVVPVEDVVAALEPDVPVLVDGAHAPGMVALDLSELDASYYVGNLHKWVCAPKGAGFISVSRRHADEVEPTVVSHGLNRPRPGQTRLQALFDWTGTGDPSARLTLPVALEVMASMHPDGWPGIRAANHDLVVGGRHTVVEERGLDPVVADDRLGSMAPMLLPGAAGEGSVDPLTGSLRHRHGIEVPVVRWQGRRILRISAQRYNRPDDYARLADALATELA